MKMRIEKVRGKWVSIAALSAALMPAVAANATVVDLTTVGDTSYHSLAGDYGGTALFQNVSGHPTGTGVFDPFLTVEAQGNSKVESGYNTDGFSALYLDQTRPQWNNLLQLKDLATTTINGVSYYTFELDANEPSGGDKNLLSVDNIRIYTSSTDNTAAVGGDQTKLNQLGTLRWAMNNPLQDASGNYNIDNWVNLDSTLSDQYSKANGGSGYSDMYAYIPTSAFAGANGNDYIWFYNLNGVHYTADSGLAAQAGYEEWKANVGGTQTVPDGGTTALLLGMGFMGLGVVRRSLKR